MSDQPNDGGPAFPRHRIEQHWATDSFDTDRAELRSEHPGMSLRDYFAAKAMEGWLTSYPADASFPSADSCDALAQQAYMLAAAMLKARGEA